MKSVLVGFKNTLLWSYSRGTWQYDALCLGIVIAVFLVPSKYFGDRDRAKTERVNEIGEHSSKAGETYVEAGALDEFLKGQNRAEMSQNPPSQNLKDAAQLYLRNRLGRNISIVNLEAFTSPEGKVIYKVRFK